MSQPEPVAFDLRPNLQRMRSDHYHCACGAMVDVCRALPWNEDGVKIGVRRVGICDCGGVVVEHERGLLKRFKL